MKAPLRWLIGITVCSWLLGILRKHRIFVFLYHNVSRSPAPFSIENRLNIPPAIFERQMRWLKSKFHFSQPDHLLNENQDKDTAMITFDDGFADYFEEALPILRKHQIPSLIFLNMAPVDGGTFWAGLLSYLYRSPEFRRIVEELQPNVRFPDIHPEAVAAYLQENPLDSSDLADYIGRFSTPQMLRAYEADPLVFYGNHFFNHYSLSVLDETAINHEYQMNRQALAKYKNHVDCVAIPFGSFGAEHVSMLAATNTRRVFDSEPYPSETSSFVLHRISLTCDDTCGGHILFRLVWPTLRTSISNFIRSLKPQRTFDKTPRPTI